MPSCSCARTTGWAPCSTWSASRPSSSTASRCASSAPFPASSRRSSRGSAAFTATPSSTRRSSSTRACGCSAEPRLRFAGQITGCEGYVESAAIGLLAGRFAAAEKRASSSRRRRRPRRMGRCSRISPAAIFQRRTQTAQAPRSYQPMNINFGLFPPLRRRAERRQAESACAAPQKTLAKKRQLTSRALADLDRWMAGASRSRRNEGAARTARARGPMDVARGAQARSFLDRGARPLRDPLGEVEAVLRRIDEVPWWSFGIACHLFGRERRALAIAGRARHCSAAPLRRPAGPHSRLDRGRRVADRQASRRPRFFRLGQGGAAQPAPRRHLPQRSRQGAELAARSRRPRLSHGFSARFLLLAPHVACSDCWRTRTCGICSSTSTAMPSRRSPPPSGACSRARTGLTALWMADRQAGSISWITRDICGSVDREGGGTQLALRRPRIAARLKAHPQVREAVVVQFYDRGARHNLYAFVEAGPDVSEHRSARLRNAQACGRCAASARARQRVPAPSCDRRHPHRDIADSSHPISSTRSTFPSTMTRIVDRRGTGRAAAQSARPVLSAVTVLSVSFCSASTADDPVSSERPISDAFASTCQGVITACPA